MGTLSGADVRRARMVSQLLAAPPAEPSPGGVATWFGALQAQDLPAALWAFGVRLPGTARETVEGAVADGQILRTWPMRGTLHFVPAADARWMLRTAGVRALRTSSARWRTLGLDQATAEAAVEVVAAALATTALLTRSALLAALRSAGISTEGQRGYHLLWYAAQTAVTCVGPDQGGEQTFALLDRWAPQQRELEGEAALGELATRYFRSHGPATRQDFQRWTGLTAADSRTGIAAAGPALASYDVDGTPVHADPAALDHAPACPVVRLLPAFDELVIGYRQDTGPVPADRLADVVPGGNGVFRPTVLVDGTVVGTWRRTLTKRGLAIAVQLWAPPPRAVRSAVDAAAQAYAAFLGEPLVSVSEGQPRG
jgi:hypothetical protein